MNNLLQFAADKSVDFYHINLYDIMTKNFALSPFFVENYDSITFVGLDYGVYGMNILKENYQD